MTILRPITFVPCHYDAVMRLLGQLTTRSITFTEDDYCKLLESSHSHLFLLFDGDAVVGMLTVGIYFSPTGSKAWIEDVVVDMVYRGRGLGKFLVDYAVEYCRQTGVDTVMLTSNPQRVAANALYRSLGFEPKETNVYRMKV